MRASLQRERERERERQTETETETETEKLRQRDRQTERQRERLGIRMTRIQKVACSKKTKRPAVVTTRNELPGVP